MALHRSASCRDRFQLGLARTEFADIGAAEQVVLYEHMPQRAVIDCMVANYLLNCFLVYTVVEDDRHTFGRVDLGCIGRAGITIPKLRLPVLLLVRRVP